MHIEYFNVDNAVSFFADVESCNVYGLWTIQNGVTKNFADMLGFDRALNVKAAVEFLLKDKSARSAKTNCGVTIRRGI